MSFYNECLFLDCFITFVVAIRIKFGVNSFFLVQQHLVGMQTSFQVWNGAHDPSWNAPMYCKSFSVSVWRNCLRQVAVKHHRKPRTRHDCEPSCWLSKRLAWMPHTFLALKVQRTMAFWWHFSVKKMFLLQSWLFLARCWREALPLPSIVNPVL